MFRRVAGIVALLLLASFCVAQEPARPRTTSRPASQPSTRPALLSLRKTETPHAPYVLYLPGISSFRSLDRRMIAGLIDSGLDATIQTYTWPAYNVGLGALLNEERNRSEARKVTSVIKAAHLADPDRPIYVVCHSGGCGIAAWAFEGLPEDIKIQQLIMLAPALSPKFDLSPTLAHISGKLYCFSSMSDPVLGKMTQMFGTIDRVNTDSAGLGGFVTPETADAILYKKLIPMPYQPDWAHFGNVGDHIGTLERSFSESVLAPLLVPAN